MTRAKDISKILTDADISGALTQDGGAVFNEASADVDFRVESNVNANMLFVDGGNNKVGINDDVPVGLLSIKGGDSGVTSAQGHANELVIENNTNGGITFNCGASNSATLLFQNSSNADDGAITYRNSEREFRFKTAGAEQVRIHSNGVLSASDGIALGVGTANTASNVLDDYEEGTWTPVFNNGGTTTFGTNGYSLGTYTKVGRLVNCQFRMSAGTMSNSDASAQVSISGLPFTVLNTTNQYSATVLYGISINLPSGYSYFAGQHAIGGTTLTLVPGGDNVGEVGLKANALTANTTQIRGSFTFFAA